MERSFNLNIGQQKLDAINRSFGIIVINPNFDALKKAYQEGTYSDSSANRKLGRAGEKYGAAAKLAGADDDLKKKLQASIPKEKTKTKKRDKNFKLEKLNNIIKELHQKITPNHKKELKKKAKQGDHSSIVGQALFTLKKKMKWGSLGIPYQVIKTADNQDDIKLVQELYKNNDVVIT